MSLRKERAAKGLCPNCGEMAAPYYLCDRCHQLAQIRRFMASGVRQGLIERVPGRAAAWRCDPKWHTAELMTYKGLDPGERDRPRLRGLPVDVDRELMKLAVSFGRSFTIEEIAAAWVKLRPRPKVGGVATNIARVIAAEDKRKRKMARYATSPAPREAAA